MSARVSTSTAKSFVRDSGRLLHRAADNAADAFTTVSQRIRKAYPAVSAHVYELGDHTVKNAKRIFPVATKQLGDWSSKTGVYMRENESRLIKIGLVYLVYKWFRSQPDYENSKLQQVKSHIKAKPVESAAIALGVGYLLGKVLR